MKRASDHLGASLNVFILTPVCRILERVWKVFIAWWNVVRPAWPIPFFALFVCALYLATPQGQEVLYVASYLDLTANRNSTFSDQALLFWISISSVALFSIASFAGFLRASCQHYPALYERALHGLSVRISTGAVFALVLPASMFAYLFVSYPSDAKIGAAQLAYLVLTLVLLFLYIVVFGRSLQRGLKPSPFSLIIAPNSALLWFERILLWTGALVLAFICISVVSVDQLPFGRSIVRWHVIAAQWFGPVGVGVLGLGTWSLIWTRLISSAERRGVPFLPMTIALLCALGVGFFGRQRNELDVLDQGRVAPSISATAYARQWLQGGHGAAIIVLAEGGGVRAAVQTATVLAQLECASHGSFMRDVFAMSGVSGGSVGIAQFMSVWRAQYSIVDCPYNSAIRASLSDNLSPTLSGLLFVDWPLSFVPADFRFPDRARLFEDSMNLGDGFLDVIEDRPRSPGTPPSPILAFNAVRSNDGRLEMVSNVLFNQADDGVCNVLSRLDRPLPLATAAHLSARFPFVSPPGAVHSRANQPPECRLPGGENEIIRYLDGGYLDNSGALGASAALRALRRAESEQRREPLRVIVVHIFTRSIAANERGDPSGLAPELTAPLNGVVSARQVMSSAPIENLCEHTQMPGSTAASLCQALSRNVTVHLPLHGDEVNNWDLISANWNVGWLNLAIDASDTSSAHRDQFIPLGWSLGASGRYAVRRSCQVARAAAPYLINPSADAASLKAMTVQIAQNAYEPCNELVTQERTWEHR